MPTLLITSWQSHFFWSPVSSLWVCECVVLLVNPSIICTNLDSQSRQLLLHTPGCCFSPRARAPTHTHTQWVQFDIWAVRVSLVSPISWTTQCQQLSCRYLSLRLCVALWLATPWFVALQPGAAIRRAGVCNYLPSSQPKRLCLWELCGSSEAACWELRESCLSGRLMQPYFLPLLFGLNTSLENIQNIIYLKKKIEIL